MLYEESKLRTIVSNSKTYAEVLLTFDKELNQGSNYIILKKYLKLYNIDVSHFSTKHKDNTEKNIEDYLNNKYPIKSSSLKNKLLKLKYFERKCYKCNLKEWFGKPIPIELHHIDGNNKNNNLSNLQILCPNCHAQTENYCSKNIKKQAKINLCKCSKQIDRCSKMCVDCFKQYKKDNRKKCQCGKIIQKVSNFCRECYKQKLSGAGSL